MFKHAISHDVMRKKHNKCYEKQEKNYSLVVFRENVVFDGKCLQKTFFEKWTFWLNISLSKRYLRKTFMPFLVSYEDISIILKIIKFDDFMTQIANCTLEKKVSFLSSILLWYAAHILAMTLKCVLSHESTKKISFLS